MPKIKPSKKALTVLVCVSVILFVVCGFTYHNRASKLNTLKAEIADKQAKLESSEQIAQRLTQVEQNYEDAQAKLSMLEQGVSTRAYVPTLLRQLEELGTKVNLRVVGVRPRPVQAKPKTTAPPPDEADSDKSKDVEAEEPKPEPYDRLDIDIEIKGKYWDVQRFLQEVTCFPKIVRVNDMQMSPVNQQQSEAGNPILTVRASTSAFILKEPQPDAQKVNQKRASTVGGRS